jgi:hypothetical protein
MFFMGFFIKQRMKEAKLLLFFAAITAANGRGNGI